MIDAIKIVRGSAWRVVHFDNDFRHSLAICSRTRDCEGLVLGMPSPLLDLPLIDNRHRLSDLVGALQLAGIRARFGVNRVSPVFCWVRAEVVRPSIIAACRAALSIGIARRRREAAHSILFALRDHWAVAASAHVSQVVVGRETALANAPFGGPSVDRVHDAIQHNDRRAFHYVQGLCCLARGRTDEISSCAAPSSTPCCWARTTMRLEPPFSILGNSSTGRETSSRMNTWSLWNRLLRDAPHRILVAQLKSQAFRFIGPTLGKVGGLNAPDERLAIAPTNIVEAIDQAIGGRVVDECAAALPARNQVLVLHEPSALRMVPRSRRTRAPDRAHWEYTCRAATAPLQCARPVRRAIEDRGAWSKMSAMPWLHSLRSVVKLPMRLPLQR